MDEIVLIIAYFGLAALLALIPANIANSKGHDPVKWWAFGFALWIVAFPAAFLIKATPKKLEEEALKKGDSKKCPQCAEVVKPEAVKCRFCGFDFAGLSPMISCPSCRRQIPRNLPRCTFCRADV